MRPDPSVSQRLQQATEQLQAAIHSTRRRRQSIADRAAQDPPAKAWRLEPAVLVEATKDDPSDAESDATHGEQEDGFKLNATSVATSLTSISPSQSPLKREELRDAKHVQEEEVNAMENDMRGALEWMQQDVENKARANRAVGETLARTIHNITDMIADCVSAETANLLLHAAAEATGTKDNNAGVVELNPDKVDELVSQWEDALMGWREQCSAEKQELVEGFSYFEEECLARMQAGEAAHKAERGRLVHEAGGRQMASEDYASRLLQALDSNRGRIQSLQSKVEELESRLSAIATTKCQVPVIEVATQTQELVDQNESLESRNLELAARLEASQLSVACCEIAMKEQAQRTSEAENCLQMLLEECQARHQRQESPVPTVDTIQLYQQKLELLESRMHDVLQQVACDHEQFEYEQARWELEKRQHREKYDEVLDASVKVLKVLIIREKLMKKKERAQYKDREETQNQQLELTRQAASLQRLTNELMHESAMVLVVLQQLTVLKTGPSQSPEAQNTWTLPAKPVQMKNIVKRLKTIEVALGRRDWVKTAESALATKVCPFPVRQKT